MIPVLSPQMIREADSYTISNEPITPLALLERAAAACTACLDVTIRNGRFGSVRTILVVSGMGNNGGDGLAMAVLLKQAGYAVAVARINHAQKPSPENAVQQQRAVDTGIDVRDCASAIDLDKIDADLIIDALFGTGLKAPLEGVAREAVGWMNASRRPIVSIDMPSGLLAESNLDNDHEGIVRALLTLTIEVPKLSLLLPENARFVGEWQVVPIGLHAEFVRNCATPYQLVEANDVRALIKPRPRFVHKGSFGHTLLIGGSLGRMGAMVLATKAALRSGAGLVTAAVPEEGLIVLQVSAPEAMCHPGCGKGVLERLPTLDAFSSVAIGPGLAMQPAVGHVLEQLLERVNVPLVVDADALNIIAKQPALLHALPKNTLLTPHPKEFERLAGRVFATGYDRLQAARQAASDWNCHIILKGAYTAICAPGGMVHFNPTGNAGMAKGGSGDALTGLLAGILAQGYSIGDTCMLGTYLHGMSGDIAADKLGQRGMTAMNLVRAIPSAWRVLSPA